MTPVPEGATTPSAAPSAPTELTTAAHAFSRVASAAAVRHRPQMLAEMLTACLDLLGRASGRLVVDTPAGPFEIASDDRQRPRRHHGGHEPQVLRHWRYPLQAPGSTGSTIGHLVIDDTEGREMSDVEQHLAASVVITLGALLSQSRALDAAEQVIAQLSTALSSRVVLEQATGILAERHGIDCAAAFDLLRVTARQQRRALQELAREVVTDPRNRRGA